jgi:rRNA-processing protein FCF1
MSERAFEGVNVLLIDGNNLLHRVSGSVEPGAQRLLIARLRGAIPPTVDTVMMLDGHADAGTNRRQKISKGFEIRHAGSMSADDALLRLIAETAPHGRAEITLVSDDIALAARARHVGVRTQRLAWLEALIGMPGARVSGATGGGEIGAGRMPKAAPAPPEEKERAAWQPGRGATRKRGNPKRRPR